MNFSSVLKALMSLLFVMATQAAYSATVVEYYNPDLDNYFITANPGEQAFVDSGAVGRWQRTGNTFASGGPSQVCRFYGSALGPNSHFYTADAGECAYLKSIYNPAAKSWKFESNDFSITSAANGTCPIGTVQVYRAYNNGFARGVDSNHRITANLTAIQQVINQGWKNEGVVMCAKSAFSLYVWQGGLPGHWSTMDITHISGLKQTHIAVPAVSMDNRGGDFQRNLN